MDDRHLKHNTTKPRGTDSGHQDPGPTGKDHAPVPSRPATIKSQIRDVHVDGKQWACDEGGLSTKFGKGAPGDKRGTSGHSGRGDIYLPVTPGGKKTADTESMAR